MKLLLRRADFRLHGLGGFAVNVQRAIMLYRRASGAGIPQAAFQLGVIYEYGISGATEVDLLRAERYYQRSIDTTEIPEAKLALNLPLKRVQVKRWAAGRRLSGADMDLWTRIVLTVADTLFPDGAECDSNSTTAGRCTTILAGSIRPRKLGGPGARERAGVLLAGTVFEWINQSLHVRSWDIEAWAIAFLIATLAATIAVLASRRCWRAARDNHAAALEGVMNQGQLRAERFSGNEQQSPPPIAPPDITDDEGAETLEVADREALVEGIQLHLNFLRHTLHSLQHQTSVDERERDGPEGEEGKEDEGRRR